jgi:hypothetical protein
MRNMRGHCRGKWEVGSGKREEGGRKREEGRGKREEGRGNPVILNEVKDLTRGDRDAAGE